MKVLITGGFGFLGRQLCDRILALGDLVGASEERERVAAVVLFDLAQPPADLISDPRIFIVSGDISNYETCASLVDEDGMIVFHLASIMSGQGEKDFDLCFKVNLMGTKNLMDACRARKDVRFIFPSSGACFGERKPGPETDQTKLLPYTSYGMTKTMCELLINDYTRRGFLDGRGARLPTVIPRPEVNSGLPAAFSAVLREPLKGQDVTLPVGPDMPHSVCGFRSLVRNLVHLAELPAAAFASSSDRTLNMPALRVTLRDLEAAMRSVVRDPSKLGSVSYEVDEALCAKLQTFHNDMDATRARKLGFFVDPSAAAIAVDFAAEFLSDTLLKQPLEIYEEPRHNPILANEHVRVYRTEAVCGDKTLWHAHRTDSLYFFLSGVRFRNLRPSVDAVEDSVAPGEVRFAECSGEPYIHQACFHAGQGGRGMFCLDVELPKRPSGDGDASGGPPLKKARSTENQIPGLTLVKDRPTVRVWQLVVAAKEKAHVKLPFGYVLWIVQSGTRVSGSLGDGVLLPAEVGFLQKEADAPLSIDVTVHGRRELRLWLVERLV